jgi:hypothetical protein
LYGAYVVKIQMVKLCILVCDASASVGWRNDPRGARHWAHLHATNLYSVGPFGS